MSRLGTPKVPGFVLDGREKKISVRPTGMMKVWGPSNCGSIKATVGESGGNLKIPSLPSGPSPSMSNAGTWASAMILISCPSPKTSAACQYEQVYGVGFCAATWPGASSRSAALIAAPAVWCSDLI